MVQLLSIVHYHTDKMMLKIDAKFPNMDPGP